MRWMRRSSLPMLMSAPERDMPRPVRLRERAEPMSGHSRSFKRGIAATGLVALLLTACATPERSAAPLPVLPPPTQAPETPVPPCARPATTALPLGMDGGQAADGADGRIRRCIVRVVVQRRRLGAVWSRGTGLSNHAKHSRVITNRAKVEVRCHSLCHSTRCCTHAFLGRGYETQPRSTRMATCIEARGEGVFNA